MQGDELNRMGGHKLPLRYLSRQRCSHSTASRMGRRHVAALYAFGKGISNATWNSLQAKQMDD